MGRKALQELPLEHFLPTIPDSCNRKQTRTNKRPLSPGGTSVVSPAKRRNLATPGVFPAERTFKSPPSSLRKSFASSARFTDVLEGPESPARKLDYGLPAQSPGDPQKRANSYQHVQDTTPTQPLPSSSRLACRPERQLRSGMSVIQSHSPQFGNISSHPHNSLLNTSQRSEPSCVLIPRALPPRTDPHSIHYPGFEIYQDHYIAAYPSSNAHDITMSDGEEDGYKENQRMVVSVPKTPSKSSLYKTCLRSDHAKSPDCNRMIVSPVSSESLKQGGWPSTTPLSKRRQGRRVLQQGREDKDAMFN